MSLSRWFRPFGRKSHFLTQPTAYRPKLEVLDDRLAPSAGPGWSNFLPISAAWENANFSAPKETSSVATHFAVFSHRDVYAGTEAKVFVVALDANDRPVKDYTGTVHLTSTDGSATLAADYTFTASDRGRHAFAVTFNTEGTQSVTAT